MGILCDYLVGAVPHTHGGGGASSFVTCLTSHLTIGHASRSYLGAYYVLPWIYYMETFCFHGGAGGGFTRAQAA